MLYSVMLVDNEPIITKGLIHLIDWASFGCTVDMIAHDGTDAIRQAKGSMPNIVITDIRMPEMDGLQLCQWFCENSPETQLILLTGFPDFEYAKQAIQYQVIDFVLKPTQPEALTAAVEKAIRNLDQQNAQDVLLKKRELERQMLFSELIYNNRSSLLFTLNRLHELDLRLSNYYVINLTVQSAMPDISAQLMQAQKIFSHCCSSPAIFVSRSDNSCYAVFNADHEEDPTMACQRSVEQADLDTDFMLTIGISRKHLDPLEMQLAAQESDDAQKFALYASQPSVIRSADLPQLSGDTAHDLLEKLQMVEDSLENGSREAALQNFHVFFDTIRQERLPYSQGYQFAQLLGNFCFGLLMSYDEPLSQFPKLRGEDLDELEKELQELLQKTLTCIHRAPSNIDVIIYDVKKYIDQNYNIPLTLDALAAQVHLSPGYFSKLFKREMGENLSTYIVNTRIEQAKLLLKTTDKKTYEIAESVGIYDPVYFSKIFKKITGLKPKEYRQQNGSNES